MEAAIFDDLIALSDATRSRMLLVLDRHELTVSELCAVLQLPQSTVSRRLKTLLDAEWVSSRRDGPSRYYTLALDDRGAGHPPALGAPPRAGQPDARRRPGCPASSRRPWPAAEQVAGVLRVRGRAVGRCASGYVRTRVSPPGTSRAARPRVDQSAIWDAARARLPRRSRRSWKQVIAVDRSSDMLDAARRRVTAISPMSTCGAASSRHCPSWMPRSMPRRSCTVLHHLPGYRRGARPKPRGCCWPRRPAASSPTCCHTIAGGSIASRWATSGSGSVEVLYWLHRSRRDLCCRPAERRHGARHLLLAHAGPAQPDRHVDRPALRAVEGPALFVRGLDCLDGTPLIDLKPDRMPVHAAGAGAAPGDFQVGDA